MAGARPLPGCQVSWSATFAPDQSCLSKTEHSVTACPWALLPLCPDLASCPLPWVFPVPCHLLPSHRRMEWKTRERNERLPRRDGSR